MSSWIRGYEARPIPGCAGAIVLAPDGVNWDSDHPTLEAAQAHALALNTWMDRRPDPRHVAPFFAPELEELPRSSRDLLETFEEILARGSRAERMHAT